MSEFSNILSMTVFSLATAALSTLLITPLAILVGLFLARVRFYGSTFLEALFFLPLVLPPVAVGLMLLSLLAPVSLLGAKLQEVGVSILLTWKANVLAQAVVSFPIYVKSVKQGFLSLPKDLDEAAAIFGISSLYAFLRIYLPLCAPFIFHGAILAFTRALGEFGATVLVAGIIPNKTETLALGIYSRIMSGHDGPAWLLCGVSMSLAFLLLLASQVLEKRYLPKH